MHLFGSRQTPIFNLRVFITNLSKNEDDLDENLTKYPLFVNRTHFGCMPKPYIFADIQHCRNSVQAEDWLQKASLARYVKYDEDKPSNVQIVYSEVTRQTPLNILD